MINNTSEFAVIRSTALDWQKKKKGHLRFIAQTYQCSKGEAKKIFEENIEKNIPLTLLIPLIDSNIIKAKGYVYNQANDKYVVPLTTYGREYVCPGDQHRAMLTSYSNWKGDERSLAEIARTFNMRREWVVEYFKVMGWTHDTVPITDEEIAQDKGQEAISRILQTKRTELQQELEHADWKEVQKDAESWRLFEAGKLDPFQRAINAWKPPVLKPMELTLTKKAEFKNVFVATISDVHIGERSAS